MRRLRWAAFGCLCMGLWGCSGGDDFADLDAYMNEVRGQSVGPIEPTPLIHSYPSFTYSASALRSPFQPKQTIDLAARQQGVSAVRPDPQRVRQYLEGFDIEQLQMVGSLSNASGSFALLRGAGGVHRLKVGDYLGRSEGRIVAIRDSQVEVVEIVPDGTGAWLERPRTLPLKTHS
ncbi:pilus assembly protein PilP [Pseudomonas sp. Fl4BN1]|uniref:pilus assembly protein PilP n=1 Tax=Pseudomonas sp. Fl4BN1 TaxID=2697651 RepID=UPI0035571E9C